MNKFFPVLAWTLAAALLAGAHAEPAKPSPSPAPRAASGPQNYDSFRLVRTRNVFDPDRRPVRPAAPSAPMPPATRADYVALTGTMLASEKTYAFFSGSRQEYNRVLTVNERIARATIAGITAQSIEIERDGKRTVVAIGQTVPFDNQSAPGIPPAAETPPPAETSTVSGAVSGSASAPAAASAPAFSYGGRQRYGGGGNNNGNFGNNNNNSAPAAAAPSGPPGNVDEIRRRMMEKRQQELK